MDASENITNPAAVVCLSVCLPPFPTRQNLFSSAFLRFSCLPLALSPYSLLSLLPCLPRPSLPFPYRLGVSLLPSLLSYRLALSVSLPFSFFSPFVTFSCSSFPQSLQSLSVSYLSKLPLLYPFLPALLSPDHSLLHYSPAILFRRETGIHGGKSITKLGRKKTLWLLNVK